MGQVFRALAVYRGNEEVVIFILDRGIELWDSESFPLFFVVWTCHSAVTMK
jgi:hypothetical protein